MTDYIINPIRRVTLVTTFLIPFAMAFVIAGTNPSAKISTGASVSTTTETVILFIGNLNFDCLPDTVYCEVNKQKPVYLPSSIHWGRWHSTTVTQPCLPTDSAQRARLLPDSTKVQITQFHYPNWKSLTGKMSTMKLNTNDSLFDMIFYLRGKTGDSTSIHDTSAVKAIFGQDALDTVPHIYLNEIDTLQWHPYCAVTLFIGGNFINPLNRDMTGKVSYVLSKIDLKITSRAEDTTSTQALMRRKTQAEESTILNVYPNPGLSGANVEGKKLQAGAYEVLVISENGKIIDRQTISVNESGELFSQIDTRQISTGFYIIQLRSNNQFVASYPFMVIH